MDRNFKAVAVCGMLSVALRKESVDRNSIDWYATGGIMVALRKESVDRNMKKGAKNERSLRSLSARRAWIEIPTQKI